MITFSGVDGSGKTTLAKRACDYLNKRGVDAVMLEVYGRSAFLNIGRCIGRFSKGTKQALEAKLASRDKRSTRLLGGLRRLCLRSDIALLRSKLSFLKSKKMEPVCDRYLYDTLVHLRYLGVVTDKQYKSFLKAIPLPELPILLSLDKNSAKDREGKHQDLEYYDEKIRLYQELAKELNFIKIDSSHSQDLVWGKVKDIIDNKETLVQD